MFGSLLHKHAFQVTAEGSLTSGGSFLYSLAYVKVVKSEKGMEMTWQCYHAASLSREKFLG